MDAILRSKLDGTLRVVELDYAVLYVLSRGSLRISGVEVRQRLLAGEKFGTSEHDVYARAAAAGRGKKAG